ncbi:hypothetical protein Taro_023523, partial [Colocasia esculenta]|nr:hypothetical protein [Colocasia esculenta]
LWRRQGKDTPATPSSFPYLRVLHTGRRLLPTPSPSSSSTLERAIGLSRGAVPYRPFSRRLNHWQLVVICNKGDNDMPFLMLLDSLHMGEPTRIENELKNFLKIAYEGKEMRAVADELKVIDLHVPKVPQQKGSTECGFMVLYFVFRFILAAPASFGTNDYPSFLTTDWFSREEYEKFREDLQGKKIHIDAQSASTSKMDSLAGRRVRILNFSGQVVASGILMSDDNDNVVMGKKLGGEYYEVSILIAHDPTASLFIKDADRKNMNDAIGSHIIWFREYVEFEDN